MGRLLAKAERVKCNNRLEHVSHFLQLNIPSLFNHRSNLYIGPSAECCLAMARDSKGACLDALTVQTTHSIDQMPLNYLQDPGLVSSGLKDIFWLVCTAQAYVKVLLGASSAPLWPGAYSLLDEATLAEVHAKEKERPGGAEAPAPRDIKETFAFFPGWFLDWWPGNGIRGAWDKGMDPPGNVSTTSLEFNLVDGVLVFRFSWFYLC